MNKIRVLPDHLANQIAAGEVVERPASAAKEILENALDAGARNITLEIEGGGRKLLRVTDDGGGMSRDDALLAFERHATSKIATTEDLHKIATLGFRGEALASIASVARVELVTKTDNEIAATRVVIEGSRIRDVKDAAHPRGTTITVRDLFYNVPARRKFLRSEATENYHLTHIVTHYALAHPAVAFTLINNGRETLRCAPTRDLRERAYQLFGASFLENLLPLSGVAPQLATVTGYVSAPHERRTTRDAQYLFVNRRYVRDKVLARALSDGYRNVLPSGTFPAALVFLELDPAEVDVNVHPAKTEVRFRRVSAIADAVRDAVRQSLVKGGYTRVNTDEFQATAPPAAENSVVEPQQPIPANQQARDFIAAPDEKTSADSAREATPPTAHVITPVPPPEQTRIDYATDRAKNMPSFEAQPEPPSEANLEATRTAQNSATTRAASNAVSNLEPPTDETLIHQQKQNRFDNAQVAAQADKELAQRQFAHDPAATTTTGVLPAFDEAAELLREIPVDKLTSNLRPLGQWENSFIIATDETGLLLIDQHIAHERILFEQFTRAAQTETAPASQKLLLPTTFDLTPAQVAVFETVEATLESYGFEMMRLSGRTIAVKAVPAALPPAVTHSLIAEILDAASANKSRDARAQTMWSATVAAQLACRAAVQAGTPLAPEKMVWLLDALLQTNAPTVSPHGRPVALRITLRDIEKIFRR